MDLIQDYLHQHHQELQLQRLPSYAGGSEEDQQNAAVPTKRKARASITDRAAKREQQAPALATPAKDIKGEEQQETVALLAKRTSRASNAEQPAKQKQQDVTDRPSRLESSVKKQQQLSAALTPAEDPKAASTSKPAKAGGQKVAAVQQGKASKWVEQLQQAGSPSAHRPSSPKQSPANPSWDTLTADDIRDQLQGAAAEFEAKKADFSMSLECASHHAEDDKHFQKSMMQHTHWDSEAPHLARMP